MKTSALQDLGTLPWMCWNTDVGTDIFCDSKCGFRHVGQRSDAMHHVKISVSIAL